MTFNISISSQTEATILETDRSPTDTEIRSVHILLTLAMYRLDELNIPWNQRPEIVMEEAMDRIYKSIYDSAYITVI